MSDERKLRTITLTDRPPVIIDEAIWPLIASASDKDFDNQYEFQANRISKWWIGVRQHDDGRAIVYATYSYTSNWQSARGFAAKRGVVLDSYDLRDAKTDTADIVRAIREVADDIRNAEHYGEDAVRWQALVNECIADLPAEVLEDNEPATMTREEAINFIQANQGETDINHDDDLEAAFTALVGRRPDRDDRKIGLWDTLQVYLPKPARPTPHEAAVKIADTVDIMMQVVKGLQPSLLPANDPEKLKWVKMFEAIIAGTEQ